MTRNSLKSAAVTGLIACLMAVLGLAVPVSGAAEPVKAAAIGALSPLELVTPTKTFSLQVELADTEPERQTGLMFRTSLDPNSGMLFDLGADEVATMWMKNTYIPLDMVFIRADGVIDSIARNTVPKSLEIIRSGGEVRAVLELKGGRAAELGLFPGDTVRHTLFGNMPKPAPKPKRKVFKPGDPAPPPKAIIDPTLKGRGEKETPPH